METALLTKEKGLTGNQLKLIAAISMLVDHGGLLLFPRVEVLRIIGRLAFPIYAFMVAEGCKYTRNRLRYFLSMFFLAFGCQAVYFVYDGSMYLSILVTFSLSILVIYAAQYVKKAYFAGGPFVARLASPLLLATCIAGVYWLNGKFRIDYGFWGTMTPVLASLFHKPQKDSKGAWEKLDRNAVHVLMLSLGLFALGMQLGQRQFYAFAAVPLLLCYSGRRGKRGMKYFFYLFYPLHLLVLQGLAMLFGGY